MNSPMLKKSTNIFPEFPFKEEKKISETLYKNLHKNFPGKKMFYYVIKLIFQVVDVFQTVKDLSLKSLFLLAINAHSTYWILTYD